MISVGGDIEFPMTTAMMTDLNETFETFETLPIPEDFGPLFPNIFTDADPTNALKPYHDWINLNRQRKRIEVYVEKQGLYWTAQINSTDPCFGFASASARETKKSLALGAAAILFRDQCMTGFAYYRRSLRTVTSLTEDLKFLAIPESFGTMTRPKLNTTIHSDDDDIEVTIDLGTLRPNSAADASAEGIDEQSLQEAQNTTLGTIAETDADIVVDIATPSHIYYMDGGVSKFDSLVDRYIHVSTIEWTTGDGAGKILASFDMPLNAIQQNPNSPNTAPFLQYLYSRPNMNHQLLLNSTEFHAGTLIMAIRYNNDPRNSNIETALQLFALPYTLIQAASANTADLDVPFMLPLPWMPNVDTQAGPGLYYHTIYIGVINPLHVGTGGTQTITAQLLTKFSTSKLKSEFAMLRTRLPLTNSTVNRLGTLKPNGPVMSTASSVAGTVSKVAHHVESAAKGIGSALRSNNQDRPLIVHDTPAVVIRNALNMPIGDGAVDAVSMRLDKSTLCPFPRDLLPVKDVEYNLDFLKKIKGVFFQFDWDVSNVRGDVLYTFQVTPIVSRNIGGPLLLPTITEIASNFTYFTGNLDLHLLFGSSTKHSGRLMIVFHPDNYISPNVIDERYDTAYVIFDLKNQLDMCFTIPNSCPTHLAPIFKTDTDGSVQGLYTYGYVSLIVETPLKIINSISTTISCTALLNGNDNFEMYVPRANDIRSTGSPTLGTLIPNAGRVESSQTLTGYSIETQPDFTIGEKPNLFSLSRRFTPYFTSTFIASADGSHSLNFDVHFGKPQARTAATSMDIVTQMHDGFRFAKGSVHYYIVSNAPRFLVKHNPRVDSFTPTPTWTPVADTYVDRFAGCAIQQVLQSVNGSVNIIVPYYNQHTFLTNSIDPAILTESWGVSRYANGNVEIVLQDCVKSATYNCTVYRALGDDAEMFCFQGFPIRANNSLNGKYATLIPVNDPGFTITIDCPAMFLRSLHDTILSACMAVTYTQSNVRPNVRMIGVGNPASYRMEVDPKSSVLLNYSSSTNGASPQSFKYVAGRKMCMFFGFCDVSGSSTYWSPDSPAWNRGDFVVSAFNYNPDGIQSFANSQVIITGKDRTGVQKFQITIPSASSTPLQRDYSADLSLITGGTIEVSLVPSNARPREIPWPLEDDDNQPLVPNGPSDDCPPLPDDPPPPPDPQDFLDQTSQPAITLEAVWNVLRKPANLPRKPRFKDPKVKHLLTKYAGVSRKVREIMLFGDVDALQGHLKGDVGLFDAARGGLSLLTGSVTNIATTAAGLMTTYSAHNTMQSVRTAADTATATLNELPGLIRSGANTVYETLSGLGSVIVEAITTRLKDILPSAVSTIVSACSHIYCLLSSQEYSVKVASFIGLLTSLGVFALSLAPQLWTLLSGCISNFSGTPLTPNSPETELAEVDHKLNLWLRFLVPALVTFFGAPAELAKKGIWALGPIFFQLVRGANDMTRFANANIDFIREAYYWFIGETRPEIPANLLLIDKAEEMKVWVDKVLDITQGHMRDIVFASSGKQKELDLLYREGQTYVTIYRVRNMDSSAFMQVFKRLIDLHSAVGQRVGRGRLINEPISFWFYGKSGVGKSNLATSVLVDTLVDMGIVYDGPAVYVRNHTDYWNGWADQPAVLWDDWGQNQSESIFANTISEYFSITSIAEYNANMPAIEDKNRMVNPYVVGVCSNRPTFRTNLVLESQALNRRRDFLINVKFSPQYANMNPPIDSASDPRVSAEDLATFNHLRFDFMDRQNCNGIPLDGCADMTYDEMMVKVKNRVTALRARLEQAASRRLDQQTALSPAAWRRRLDASLVPENQLAGIQRDLHIETASLNLTDAITRQTTAIPNCDGCFYDGASNTVVHDQPMVDYYDFDDDETQADDGFNHQTIIGCICDQIATHGQWCPRKFSYRISKDDCRWYQPLPDDGVLGAPPPPNNDPPPLENGPYLLLEAYEARGNIHDENDFAGYSPEERQVMITNLDAAINRQRMARDAARAAAARLAPVVNEPIQPPAPLNRNQRPTRYDLRGAPQDIYIHLTRPCSAECVWRLAPSNNPGTLPDVRFLRKDQAHQRWVEYLEGWRRRYGDIIPPLGALPIHDFFANAPGDEEAGICPHPTCLVPYAALPDENIDWEYLSNTRITVPINQPAMLTLAQTLNAYRMDPDRYQRRGGDNLFTRTVRTQMANAHTTRSRFFDIANLITVFGGIIITIYMVLVLYKLVWAVFCYFFPTVSAFVGTAISVIARSVFATLLAAMCRQALTYVVGNVASSGDVTTRTARVIQPVIRGNGPDTTTEPTSFDALGLNRHNGMDIEKKISRNTMILEQYNPATGKRQVYQMLSPGGRVVMIPWHYNFYLRENASKGFESNLHVWSDVSRNVYKLDVTSINPTRIGQRDLAYFHLPLTVPAFPSLTGVFATSRDASELFGGRALLISGHDYRNDYKTTTRVFEDVKFINGTATYEMDGNKLDIEILGYRYPFAQAGACMSALVDTKTKHIIGFHTTGTSDDTVGYSTVCPREFVKAILSTEVVTPGPPSGEITPNCSKMEEQLAKINLKVPVVRRLPAKQRLRTSIKTNIDTTPMHGVLGEPSRFPAKLSDKDNDLEPGYAPLAEAVAKGFSEYAPFPDEFVSVAANDLREELLVKAAPVTMSSKLVRSREEAIVGLRGVQFCEGLRLNTSPGWPLCVMRPGSDKTSFIKTDEMRSFVELDPLLVAMLDKEEEQRKEGEVPFSVYADFGKDERLKPGKAMRLINGCPLAQTILWRQYCMDFFAAFQKAQLSVGSAIGLNPFGTGMQEMAQKLLAMGPHILTGDYKNFGPTVHPEVLSTLSDAMDDWYRKNTDASEEDFAVASRVRRTLVESIMNSFHVAGDLIYQTYQGSPSGNPYTAPINTYCALIYLRVVWQDIFKASPHQGMAVMQKNFSYICYGDDFVGSISPNFLSKFNNVTMSQSFAKFKLIFTNPQKDGSMELSCPLEEASFLKCTFARHVSRDLYVAHLDKKVILDIPNWCRLPVPDMMQHLKELSDQALRFLALYGPDEYNKNSSKLKRWFAERGEFLPVNDWSVVDQVFSGEEQPTWIDCWW